jgi:ribosome-associated protein
MPRFVLHSGSVGLWTAHSLIVIEGLELATAAARSAEGKQAEDITVLDLRGLSTIADYFVVCSGTSLPHLKAIYREVFEQLSKEHDVKPRTTEGIPESQWLILDYSDVIVHVMHSDKRLYYALEDLWNDAPRVEVGVEARG